LQLLEFLDARNFLQRELGIAHKHLFLQRAMGMVEREDDGMADHASDSASKDTASLAAIAAMLTMPRLVVDGARICAGERGPIRIGPTASPLVISLSSVIDRFADSRLGKISRLASPFNTVSGM